MLKTCCHKNDVQVWGYFFPYTIFLAEKFLKFCPFCRKFLFLTKIRNFARKWVKLSWNTSKMHKIPPKTSKIFEWSQKFSYFLDEYSRQGHNDVSYKLVCHKIKEFIFSRSLIFSKISLRSHQFYLAHPNEQKTEKKNKVPYRKYVSLKNSRLK